MVPPTFLVRIQISELAFCNEVVCLSTFDIKFQSFGLEAVPPVLIQLVKKCLALEVEA